MNCAGFIFSLFRFVVFFLLNTGPLPGLVSGITVVKSLNGTLYVVSDVKVPYANMSDGCAAMNASPVFFNNNDDFIAFRDSLGLIESLKNSRIWVNVTQINFGSGTFYSWGKEKINMSLFWSGEPNKQGAGENLKECSSASETCRPIIMTRLRFPQESSTHDLMDTCCLYYRYFFCEDNDECQMSSPCPVLSQCVNTAGSYQCVCDTGYIMNPAGLCEDIDECSFHVNYTCPEFSDCLNTPGTFTCLCRSGYQMESQICQDIDECNFPANYTCPKFSECLNTPGTFTCMCQSGYQMESEVCQDIDECRDSGELTCPSASLCTNTAGSYKCICMEGFWMNNSVCEALVPPSPHLRDEDVDECANTMRICPSNSYCVNTKGSYQCDCEQGYRWDEIGICQDIDECSSGTFTCSRNSLCNNIPGSYTCVCDDGFEGNSSVCQDVDECTNNTQTCPSNSYCSNTEGSFDCDCEQGFQWVNNTCQAVPSQPIITVNSSVHAITSGINVVLSCESTDFDPNQSSATLFQWVKDGVDLNISDRFLRLNNVSEGDQGHFQCYLTYGGSLQSPVSIMFILTFSDGDQMASDRTSKKCPCKCRYYLMPNLTEELSVIKTDLSLEASTLSSRIRARGCVQDWRTSSVATASVSVIISLFLFVWIIAPDVRNLAQYVNILCCRHTV